MSETTLFDKEVFDSVIFDTKGKFEVTLEEQLQVFDEDVFDSVIFDVREGGEVVVTDEIARVGTQIRHISDPRQVFDDVIFDDVVFDAEGVTLTISDSVSRLLGALRSMSDSTTVAVGIPTTSLDAARTIPDSVSISDSIGGIINVFRYITDPKQVFDSVIFDNALFDIAGVTSIISDTVSRTLGSLRAITDTGISISDSISRIIGYVLSLIHI